MRHPSFAALALAVAAGATWSTAAEVDWMLDGDGSWADNANWSSAPDWEGADVLKLNNSILTANRTLTLDGDRVIDTLHVYTQATSSSDDFTYTITPGTGGTLQLNKLVVDRNDVLSPSGGYRANALDLTNVVTRIDDGVESATSVWEIMPSYVNSYFVVKVSLGQVQSVAGSLLQVDFWARGGGSSNNNHPVLTLTQSNLNFLGDITFNGRNGSKNFVVEVGASDALGVNNNVNVKLPTSGADLSMSIGFTATTNTTHSSNINVENQILRMAAANGTTATITGNLTGNGRLIIDQNLTGYYNIGTGTIVLAGDANTLSGDVKIGETSRAGNLRVDGTWTGAGNITLGQGSLSGSGSIGMAENKVFTTLLHTSQANRHAYIAPGTNGTIGTLTIGTAGNNNQFTLQGASNTQTNWLHLQIDLDGNTSDLLVLNGDLTIGAFTRLVFTELSPLTASSYTILTYSGSLTGTFVDVVGLPEGYELDYSTPGQINLVPEPAALSLLALGTVGLLRRRRR